MNRELFQALPPYFGPKMANLDTERLPPNTSL